MKDAKAYFKNPEISSIDNSLTRLINVTKDYLQIKYETQSNWAISIVMADSDNLIIGHKKLFDGDTNGASDYSGAIAKACLEDNAAAVFLCQNHPSWPVDPSSEDIKITLRLRESLSLIGVRLLDHLIVGSEGTYSFAENGYL